MKNKSKISSILIFLFGFLIISSCFIIPNISAGTDFNIPIYIQTSAGLEKAEYYDIVEILFNHDFEIQEKQEIIADETCSLRAEKGTLTIDSIIFNTNDLSFNMLGDSGKGSLTVQNNNNRFSLTFDIKEILQTNSEKLVFKAKGVVRLNKQEFNIDDIIVSFDKMNNKVSVNSPDYKNFQATNLEVTFTQGCLSEMKNFYLLIDKGLLGKSRSADEVVQILRNNPEFLDVYWNLEKIHKPKWWIHISQGNPGSIWTTRNDCGGYDQNVNEYNISEYVYINGANFMPGEYDWTITGQPGAASCDPNIVVAFGSLSVGNSGAFCFNAYQIQQGDCKEYKVDFNNKQDTYTVIPEFTPLIGILTLFGAVSVFFLVRKR